MSAIRSTLEVAGQSVKGARQIIMPVNPQNNITPSHDQDMMYAWSIGVTNVGRAYGEPVSHEPSHREEEACPPEVYIG